MAFGYHNPYAEWLARWANRSGDANLNLSHTQSPNVPRKVAPWRTQPNHADTSLTSRLDSSLTGNRQDSILTRQIDEEKKEKGKVHESSKDG